MMRNKLFSAKTVAILTAAVTIAGTVTPAMAESSTELTTQAAVEAALNNNPTQIAIGNGEAQYTLSGTHKNTSVLVNASNAEILNSAKLKSINITDANTLEESGVANKINSKDNNLKIHVATGSYGSKINLAGANQNVNVTADGNVDSIQMDEAGTLNLDGSSTNTVNIKTTKKGTVVNDAAKSSKVTLGADTEFNLKNGANAGSIFAADGLSKINIEQGATAGVIAVSAADDATSDVTLNGTVKKFKIQKGVGKMTVKGSAADFPFVINSKGAIEVGNKANLIVTANATITFTGNASGSSITAYNGAKVNVENKTAGNIIYTDTKGVKYTVPANSVVKDGVASGAGITAQTAGGSVTATTSPLYAKASEANKKAVTDFEKKYADLLKNDLDYSKLSTAEIANAIKEYEALSNGNTELKTLLAVDYAHLVSAQVLANSTTAQKTVKAFEDMFANVLTDKPDYASISSEQVTAARAAYNWIIKNDPDAEKLLANDLKKLETVERGLETYTKKTEDEAAITKWRTDNKKVLATSATISTVTYEEVKKALDEYATLVTNAKNPSTVYTTLSMDKARLDTLARAYGDQKAADDKTAAGKAANAFVADSTTAHILDAASGSSVTVTSDELQYVMGNYNELSSDVQTVLVKNGTKVKLDRVQSAMDAAAKAQAVFDANVDVTSDRYAVYSANVNTTTYPADIYSEYKVTIKNATSNSDITVKKESKPLDGKTITWKSTGVLADFTANQNLIVVTSVQYKPAGSNVTYISNSTRTGLLTANKKTDSDSSSGQAGSSKTSEKSSDGTKASNDVNNANKDKPDVQNQTS